MDFSCVELSSLFSVVYVDLLVVTVYFQFLECLSLVR